MTIFAFKKPKCKTWAADYRSHCSVYDTVLSSSDVWSKNLADLQTISCIENTLWIWCLDKLDLQGKTSERKHLTLVLPVHPGQQQRNVWNKVTESHKFISAQTKKIRVSFIHQRHNDPQIRNFESLLTAVRVNEWKYGKHHSANWTHTVVRGEITCCFQGLLRIFIRISKFPCQKFQLECPWSWISNWDGWKNLTSNQPDINSVKAVISCLTLLSH